MNPLIPIQLSILLALARYYTLTRMQLQDLCAEPGTDPNGRRMRKHLTTLRHEGYIHQTHGRVVFPERNGAPAPVYHISRKGCELLAEVQKDASFLNACTLTPTWQHLYHWIRIAELRILFDRAVALQNDVRMDHWLTEWTVANPEEKLPEKRYSLFTLAQEQPRVVCAADASCVLSYRGFLKGLYFEIDRATSGIQQIAHSKTPGYAKMAERGLHVRHFPGVKLPPPPRGEMKPVAPFTVLHVSPSEGRRDLIARAIRGKPGDRLWKFTSWDLLRPETALYEPILVDVDGKPSPLVRRLEGGTT